MIGNNVGNLIANYWCMMAMLALLRHILNLVRKLKKEPQRIMTVYFTLRDHLKWYTNQSFKAGQKPYASSVPERTQ
jgi:hypothetical protein